MANVKSAEKRNRQRVKRRRRNLQHRTKMRTQEKSLRTLLQNKDGTKAKTALPEVISAIAKAAQRGAVNTKTASRHISRLSAAVHRLTAKA